MSKSKCLICHYIKKEGFPFGYSRNRYFIDSEGCFKSGSDHITIKFCPKCGRQLERKDEKNSQK